MKTLIALLASTSICLAASVGVSKEQLRDSGQSAELSVPNAERDRLANDLARLHKEMQDLGQHVPELWGLIAVFHYDDGSESGVEVSQTIKEFMSQDRCEAEKVAHEKSAAASKVILECRLQDAGDND